MKLPPASWRQRALWAAGAIVVVGAAALAVLFVAGSPPLRALGVWLVLVLLGCGTLELAIRSAARPGP